jgi:hypothetical protein
MKKLSKTMRLKRRMASREAWEMAGEVRRGVIELLAPEVIIGDAVEGDPRIDVIRAIPICDHAVSICRQKGDYPQDSSDCGHARECDEITSIKGPKVGRVMQKGGNAREQIVQFSLPFWDPRICKVIHSLQKMIPRMQKAGDFKR